MQYNYKKKIYIFLNNKIMSCDTILPLIMDVKNKNNLIDICFVSFDYQTYNFIKKNVLLYKVIKDIGDIKCLGRKKNTKYFRNNKVSKLNIKRLNILSHIIKVIPFFVKIIFDLIFKNVIFIHFRALSLWPLKILYFLNKTNTIYSNADSSGWSNTAYKAKRSLENKSDIQFTGAPPCGTKVIAFSKYWPMLQHSALEKSKKYIIESSHSRKIWLDYLKSNVDMMLFKEHSLRRDDDYYLLVLGHIGLEGAGARFLRNKDSWITLIEDILDIINEEYPGITVVIKPHIITNMYLLDKILSSRKHIKVIISYLHPALLSVRAKFTVGSHYSTAFQSIYHVGSIIIEYTDQKKEYAKKLNFKSQRPEFVTYFFNNDEKEFRNLLNKMYKGMIKNNLHKGLEGDSTGLMKYLAE